MAIQKKMIISVSTPRTKNVKGTASSLDFTRVPRRLALWEKWGAPEWGSRDKHCNAAGQATHSGRPRRTTPIRNAPLSSGVQPGANLAHTMAEPNKPQRPGALQLGRGGMLILLLNQAIHDQQVTMVELNRRGSICPPSTAHPEFHRGSRHASQSHLQQHDHHAPGPGNQEPKLENT